MQITRYVIMQRKTDPQMKVFMYEMTLEEV